MNLNKEKTHEMWEREKGIILKFEGLSEDRDVYNPAVLENSDGSLLLAARVESRQNATDARIMFFTESTLGTFRVVDRLPKFDGEDPDLVRIGDELILSMVQADWDKTDPTKLLGLRQIFYRGKSPEELQEFTKGPEGMKNIHLVGLSDGKIGVYTRPQNDEYGRGKICYKILDSLDELNPENIVGGCLLEDRFEEDEWEGVNAVYANISENCECHGVLAHKASRDEDGVHYVATAFIYNPLTQKRSAVEQIASRGDFPPGKSKRVDLKNVVYPGGLVRLGDGTAMIYVGLNDVDVARRPIKDPFSAHVCP